jgi:hypothetical protein
MLMLRKLGRIMCLDNYFLFASSIDQWKLLSLISAACRSIESGLYVTPSFNSLQYAFDKNAIIFSSRDTSIVF